MTFSGLRLSELIGSLSHALDMTEGQPRGHCIRCCWIGSRLGERLGLDAGCLLYTSDAADDCPLV